MCIEQNKTKFEGIYWHLSLWLFHGPKSASHLILFRPVALLEQLVTHGCDEFVHVKVFVELL